MKRFVPILLVLAGWFFAQFAGTPQQVYARARISVSSLQTAIEDIINGNTTVGHATTSDSATVADSATIADFALVAEQARSVPAEFGGSAVASTPGELRFNMDEGTLQVSDGTVWLALAYEAAP